MSAVWDPRFAELVKTLAALRESTSLELLPDIMPVMNVLEDDPEYAFQRGERYGASSFLVNAVAGSYGHARIVNPTASDTMVVLKRCRIATGAGTIYGAFYKSGTSLASQQNRVALDGRDGRYAGTIGTQANMIALVSTTTGVASLVNAQNRVAGIAQAGTTSVDVLLGDIVIPPGWSFTVETPAVNLVLGGEMMWEERPGCLADELRVK